MKGLALALALSLIFGSASAADGQNKIFNEVCSECHEVGDFSGENPNDIAKTISKIVAGEVKHRKKLQLSAEEAMALALILVDDNP